MWKDAFENNPALLEKVGSIYGNGLSLSAAVDVIANLYTCLSQDIHNPGFRVVPIRLGLLSENEAKVMVELCRRLPIRYQVLDSDSLALDNALYE